MRAVMEMNVFAIQAREHWRTFLPTRYAAIEDPDSFFSTLGEQVEEKITELTEDLAGDDPPGETYLEKLGRLNAARQMARERVLAEQVLLPAEAGSPMDEDSLAAAQPNTETSPA